MQQYALMGVLFGTGVLLLSSSLTTASVISCPPSNLQEASPNLRQLCYAIEQAISENAIPQDQCKERRAKTQFKTTPKIGLRFKFD